MKALRLTKEIIIIGLIIVVCFFLFDKCNNKLDVVTHTGNDSLIKVIAEQTKIKDSLLLYSKKKDTIRLEIVKRFRILKTDTIYQICEPIIKLCDSLIVVDSSLISDLKKVITIDSTIIHNYKKVVKNDSATIVQLTKEVKKHKRHKRWLMAGLIGIGIVAAVK